MIQADFELFTTVRNQAWRIDISKWSPSEGMTTLLNENLNPRDFVRLSRNPRISTIINVIRHISNFNITGRIETKKYHVQANFMEIASILPLRYFYRPNIFGILEAGFYEQVPVGNLTKIAFLSVGIVIEKLCKDKM